MHLDKYYIGKLPIKNIGLKAQQPFITLVDQILTITNVTQPSWLSSANTSKMLVIPI